MQREVCERCGTAQPREWRAGDLCAACGGGVRAEARCAWCCAFSPLGAFCRKCGCDLVPPERFGAARMLKAAGVDRLALAERLRALDPGRLELFASQWATQWAVASRRIEEAAFCESFLLQKGWAAELEDQLAGMLPLSEAGLADLGAGPVPPFDDDSLPGILAGSPSHDNRALAALALLRRGRPEREAVELVRGLLFAEGRWGMEAALALAGWRIGEAGRLRHEREVFHAAAERAFAVPKLRPYAAVALAAGPLGIASWQSGSEEAKAKLAALAPALREGLDLGDPDLRFSCALALRDEASLGPYLDSTDEDQASLARRALAASGSRLVARRLAEGSDAVRKDVLRGLVTPLEPELLGALLEGAARGGEDYRKQALRFVRQARCTSYGIEARDLLGAWYLDHAELVGAEEALDALSWASDPPGREPYELPRDEPDVRPFFFAAAGALARVESAAAKELLRGADFERWLALARGAEAEAVLDRFSRDPLTAAKTLESIVVLQSRASRGDRLYDPGGVALLAGIWERAAAAGAHGAVAPALAEAFADNRGTSGRDDILRAFWDRFVARPEERRALFTALRPWKQELFELRDKGPALDGGDAVAFFRLWWEADGVDLIDVEREAEERARPEHLAPLFDLVCDAAEGVVASRPRSAIVAVFRMAARIANGFREDEGAASHSAAVERLRARWPAFEVRFRAAVPGSSGESGAEHFIEDVETELRLIGEAEERRAEAEQARKDRERREKEREEERLRREKEREEAERRAAEARLLAVPALAAPPAPVPPVPVPPLTPPRPLVPDLEPSSIDAEPFLAGQPLPTLRDYAGFLKALQAGGDVLALMASRGMTVQTWSACSTAWSGVLMKNPTAALRFAELLSASWR